MIDRVEQFALRDGRGFINVRGDEFDSALYIDGKPMVLNWCDCQGSVGQYLIRAGAVNVEESLVKMRHIFDGNLSETEPIAAQIEELLHLCSPGNYELRYTFEQFDSCNEFSDKDDLSTQCYSWYPCGTSLVLLQSAESLNTSRIEEFESRIRTGQRPIIVCVGVKNACCAYLIDGHHKLFAYWRASVPPAMISICKLNEDRITNASVVDELNVNHAMAPHYRKVKKSHERWRTFLKFFSWSNHPKMRGTIEQSPGNS